MVHYSTNVCSGITNNKVAVEVVVAAVVEVVVVVVVVVVEVVVVVAVEVEEEVVVVVVLVVVVAVVVIVVVEVVVVVLVLVVVVVAAVVVAVAAAAVAAVVATTDFHLTSFDVFGFWLLLMFLPGPRLGETHRFQGAHSGLSRPTSAAKLQTLEDTLSSSREVASPRPMSCAIIKPFH